MFRDMNSIAVAVYPRHEFALGRRLDVPGQQHRRAAGRLDAQHAGGVVVVTTRRDRVQPFEAHLVPDPVLAGETVSTAVSPALSPWKRPQDRIRATGMVGVAMRHDQPVEMTETLRAQGGDDNRRTGIETAAIGWPGVVDEAVPMRPDQHGRPLPHIQHVHPHA